MRDGDARRHVFTEKQFLDGDLVGRKFIENFPDALLEHGKAHGQTLFFGREHDAVILRGDVSVFILMQNPVAERGKARVDPQNNQIFLSLL